MPILRRTPPKAAVPDYGCLQQGQRPGSGRCLVEAAKTKAWHYRVRQHTVRAWEAMARAKAMPALNSGPPPLRKRSAAPSSSPPSLPPNPRASILRPACCRLAWAAALIVLPAFIAASAQTQAPTYEKSTEAKIQGSIRQITVDSEGMVHLAVRGRRESYDVLLAPQRFLKFLGIIYHEGEKVEVVGSRVTAGDSTLWLARRVMRQGDEVRYRDSQGGPAWSYLIE